MLGSEPCSHSTLRRGLYEGNLKSVAQSHSVLPVRGRYDKEPFLQLVVGSKGPRVPHHPAAGCNNGFLHSGADNDRRNAIDVPVPGSERGVAGQA